MSDMTLFDVPDAGAVRADDPHTSVEAARTNDAGRNVQLWHIRKPWRMETVPVAGERL